MGRNQNAARRVFGRAVAAVIAVAALTAQAPQRADWTAVHIRECSVLKLGRMSPETGGVTIQYVNQAPVAAKEVTFHIVYHGTTVSVTDKGTFGPGASVDHTFTYVLFRDTYVGSTPDVCRVQKVVFADGTISQAPASQPSPAH